VGGRGEKRGKNDLSFSFRLNSQKGKKGKNKKEGGDERKKREE